MRRASYRHAVEWIARNDEPMDLDPARVGGYISTVLVADLFEVEPEEVAAAIVRKRKKIAKDEAKET